MQSSVLSSYCQRLSEKLYEELLIGDDVETTAHPLVFKATEAFIPWAELPAVSG